FQAEDGIRYKLVTGVQTCALPICLRDRLLAKLESALDGVHVNGSREHRLAGNLNVSFERVEGDALLVELSDLALSAASACGSHGDRKSVVKGKSIGLCAKPNV